MLSHPEEGARKVFEAKADDAEEHEPRGVTHTSLAPRLDGAERLGRRGEEGAQAGRQRHLPRACRIFLACAASALGTFFERETAAMSDSRRSERNLFE